MASASTMVSGLSEFDWATGPVSTPSAEEPEGLGPWPRVEQHGDLGRAGDLAGRDEGELVQQALRVLHDADHLAGLAALACQVSPMVRLKVAARPCVTATCPGPAG